MYAVSTFTPLAMERPCDNLAVFQTTDVVKDAACGSSSCNCGSTCGCKEGECKC
ncbi:hypothetical protein LXA43DRAFT_990562 [Ganoderma leucocontextum]|nr:hypothetical protein LXA43DRAFT_990562 [Ganoderma leucocontextum]